MLAGGRGSCAVGLFDKGRHALYNDGGKYPMVLKMLFTKGGGSMQPVLWAAGGTGFTCLMTALGASMVLVIDVRSGFPCPLVRI